MIDGVPGWIGQLRYEALLQVVHESSVLGKAENVGKTIDEVGDAYLPPAIDGQTSYFNWPDYWDRLKDEFRILVCTKDRKYSKLRKQLSSGAGHSQATIISIIAAAMGARFGTAAGALVPFVALCLLALVRLGKEAFCAGGKWSIPLGPP